MLLQPPKFITSISSENRDEILRLVLEQDQLGLMWQEKIRKYICFHNRNLGKVSKLRFADDHFLHIVWMRDMFLTLAKRSLETNITYHDSSILNAALIANDACPQNKSKTTELEVLLQLLITQLKFAESIPPRVQGKTPPFNYNIERLSSGNSVKTPITIFSPSPYSLFTLCTIKLLLALDIEIKSIVFLRFSYQRIKSEFYRDGLNLFVKRVWRKLILKADENKDHSEIGLKSLNEAFHSKETDVRKLAQLHKIKTFKVNEFNDYINESKSSDGGFCIFTGGGLINKNVLEYFTDGILNIHMGTLPQYKGMDVVEAPILDGCFKDISLTCHMMAEKLDAGPVIQEIKFNSDDYHSLGSLRNEMSALMPILAVDSALKILNENFNAYPQIHGGKQYYFIHRRLRDVISDVINFRYKQNYKSLDSIRDINLNLYNSVLSDVCKRT